MAFDVTYTVSQLNDLVHQLLEACEPLRDVLVQGEISNYKAHSSGHHYLSLKDEGASLPAVMFRYDASRLRFRPENGMKVIARGRLSTFARTGQVQLYITQLQPDGVGALHLAFEQTRKRLEKEGLFDPKRKKPLPAMPEKIALVTSDTGAVARDMIRILRRRWPLTQVVLVPVKVQGEGAAGEIAQGILYCNNYSLADVIIVGRGGGSMEDLWAFNEEAVARAIALSDLPVISAVGHEPDVTIADYVADVRAATPSHAAELAVPDRREVEEQLQQLRHRLERDMSRRLFTIQTALTQSAGRLERQSPLRVIQDQRMLLEHLTQRLARGAQRGLTAQQQRLERADNSLNAAARQLVHGHRSRFALLVGKLDALSPYRVLSRGYALVQDETGRVVVGAQALRPGQSVRLGFADSWAQCLIEKTGGKDHAG